MLPNDARGRLMLLAALTVVSGGLACAGVWNNTLGYSAALFSSDGTEPLRTSDAYLVGRLAVALALIPLARVVYDRLRWVFSAAVMVMCFSTFVAVLSPLQGVFDPQALAGTSVLLGSMCYTVATTSFYVLLAERAEDRWAAGAIALSLVLETVLSAMIGTGEVVLQVTVVIGAPVVVGVAYVAACALFKMGQPASKSCVCDWGTQGRRATRAGQGFLLARLAAYTIALVFIRALSDVGIWGRSRTGFMGMEELSLPELALVSALVILLALAVYILPYRLSTTMRSLVGFAVVLGGLQLLAFSEGSMFGTLFDLTTVSCELFAHLLMWMAYIECVKGTEVPAFRITGVRSIVYVIVTFALSWALDMVHAPVGTLIMTLNYALFLFVLVSLILARGSASRTGPGAERTGVPEFGKEREVRLSDVDRFAKAHRLSEREAQIAALLLEQTKRADIERICGLSEGTVRTHISRTYRKLDVHSRTELRELFDRECGEN